MSTFFVSRDAVSGMLHQRGWRIFFCRKHFKRMGGLSEIVLFYVFLEKVFKSEQMRYFVVD